MNPANYLMGGVVVIGAYGFYKLSALRGGMPVAPMNRFVNVLGRDCLIHVPDNCDGTQVVVYFHGFSNNIRTRGPKLVSAMGTVSRKPIFIMPQLRGKSEPGDLATRFAAFLESAYEVAGLTGKPQVDMISHSGGYRAMADALGQVNVRSIALLDSLYGRYEEYRRFALKTSGVVVDVYGPTTSVLSAQLKAATVGRKNVLVQSTTVSHDAIPEHYMASVLESFSS